MKKFTKSEANLTELSDTEEGEHLKEALRKNTKYGSSSAVYERGQNISRQRVVSCPESDQIRSINKGFYSTIIDLKRICEEGL